MVSIAGAGVRRDPTLPAFTSSVQAIDAATLERMRHSHRAGCPVATADLRLVRVTHFGFDRRARTGELVVHRTAATAMTQVFARLYAARFPVERMLLVDAYRGDDHASMAANNTSAYNCREVEGGGGWSEHAYGTALDINPVQNPYVTASTVLPPAGRSYLDRGNDRPGMVVRGDVVVTSFAAHGWEWGGDFRSLKDYQHFSASGG
jgi:poly-gamma-glutamate synthesis protein (capsule biosynthesis protein)